MTFLRVFLNFWYDFLVGDDWKIAVYTIVALGVVGWLVRADFLSDGLIAIIGLTMLAAFFTLGVLFDAEKMSRNRRSGPSA